MSILFIFNHCSNFKILPRFINPSFFSCSNNISIFYFLIADNNLIKIKSFIPQCLFLQFIKRSPAYDKFLLYFHIRFQPSFHTKRMGIIPSFLLNSATTSTKKRQNQAVELLTESSDENEPLRWKWQLGLLIF